MDGGLDSEEMTSDGRDIDGLKLARRDDAEGHPPEGEEMLEHPAYGFYGHR